MERLKRWLEETGTHQKDLAERCNVSAGLIGHYVNGRTKPSFEALLLLARETGLSLAELVAEFEPNPADRPTRSTHALSA